MAKKRYSDRKEISNIKMLPMIKIGEWWDIMNYIIEYNDWEYEFIRINKNNYRDRALLQWEKSINDELNRLSYEYERHIREVNWIKDCKEWEYLLTQQYLTYDELGKRNWYQSINIAVEYNWLSDARINLYDIIGRLVSSSPYYNRCWTSWFKDDDLYTSLFIEADEILCSLRCPREKRVSKIYYLTHFMNENKTIWNNFKVDKEFDIAVDKVVSSEVSNPLYRWIHDYHKFWIIDDIELCILLLIEKWYKENYISTCLWINKKKLKDRMNDIKEKLKCFIL